jgi:hypothetical protein
MFTCPWCQRDLKEKLSTSEKNPNRGFFSCNKDFDGCGLFCFSDATPDERFNPAKKQDFKRARREGGGATALQVVGPVANQPGIHDQRLAELATKLDALVTIMHEVRDYIHEVNQ